MYLVLRKAKYIYRASAYKILDWLTRGSLVLLCKIGATECTELRERAILVSFEGSHGAGKTTQIQMVQRHLLEQGIATYQLSLPAYGITLISQFLKWFYRQPRLFSFLHKAVPFFNTYIILLDFWEARLRLAYTLYKSSVTDKVVILSARGLLSTYAHNLPFFADFFDSRDEALRNLALYCNFLWVPDFIFYLNVRPGICSNRIESTRTKKAYESLEDIAQTEETFATMKDYLLKRGTIISDIDGEQSPEKICEEISSGILGLFTS